MTVKELELRIENLEREVHALRDVMLPGKSAPDWRRTMGAFAKDPEFQEIVREGAEYRRQQQPAGGPC